MAVDLIEEIDQAKSFLRQFILWPDKWNAFPIDLGALNWQEYVFRPASLVNIPESKGVYTFVIKPNIANHPSCAYLMYVGKTIKQDLRTRFRQYLDEQAGKGKPRPKVEYILSKYSEHLYFVCLPLDEGFDPTAVEDELMKAWAPPVNDAWPAEVRRVYKSIFV